MIAAGGNIRADEDNERKDEISPVKIQYFWCSEFYFISTLSAMTFYRFPKENWRLTTLRMKIKAVALPITYSMINQFSVLRVLFIT